MTKRKSSPKIAKRLISSIILCLTILRLYHSLIPANSNSLNFLKQGSGIIIPHAVAGATGEDLSRHFVWKPQSLRSCCDRFERYDIMAAIHEEVLF